MKPLYWGHFKFNERHAYRHTHTHKWTRTLTYDRIIHSYTPNPFKYFEPNRRKKNRLLLKTTWISNDKYLDLAIYPEQVFHCQTGIRTCHHNFLTWPTMTRTNFIRIQFNQTSLTKAHLNQMIDRSHHKPIAKMHSCRFCVLNNCIPTQPIGVNFRSVLILHSTDSFDWSSQLVILLTHGKLR